MLDTQDSCCLPDRQACRRVSRSWFDKPVLSFVLSLVEGLAEGLTTSGYQNQPP
jgi:hypothetical protein